MRKWRQILLKVKQTTYYTMLVLYAKIHLIIFSPISSNMPIKTVCFHLQSCNIHTYKLSEDVYMTEEVKTNIPQSKTNNPLY